MSSESDERVASGGSKTNELAIIGHLETRRKFIKQVVGTSADVAIGPYLVGSTALGEVNPVLHPWQRAIYLK
jgi:hypothetical protein